MATIRFLHRGEVFGREGLRHGEVVVETVLIGGPMPSFASGCRSCTAWAIMGRGAAQDIGPSGESMATGSDHRTSRQRLIEIDQTPSTRTTTMPGSPTRSWPGGVIGNRTFDAGRR